MWAVGSTCDPRLALVSVHDEAVPRSQQHPAQLGDGEGVGVLAHCAHRTGTDKHRIHL